MDSSRQDGSLGVFQAFQLNINREGHEKSLTSKLEALNNNRHQELKCFLGGTSGEAHASNSERTENNTSDLGNLCEKTTDRSHNMAMKVRVPKEHMKANADAMFWNWLSPRAQSFNEPKMNNNTSFLAGTAMEPPAAPTNDGLILWENIKTKPSATLAASNSQICSEDSHSLCESKKRPLDQAMATVEARARKTPTPFGHRTSVYRGVTKHRWTGRFEAHLWDSSCKKEGQSRKGRQIYLGGYDKEDKAASAYDLVALKYWGASTPTNFPISKYNKELEEMKHMSKQEYVNYIRRNSSGFSRGASVYRGVTRHHQPGKWQARIGRVAGNKDLYLGTYSSQEEAAEAYDIAVIKYRGPNAVTNFDKSRYDIESIIRKPLPIGGFNKRHKAQELANVDTVVDGHKFEDDNISCSQTDTISHGKVAAGFKSTNEWPLLDCQQQQNPLMASYLRQINENQQLQMQVNPFSCHMHLLPPMSKASGTVLHNLMSLDSAAIEANNTSAGIYPNITNGFPRNGLTMSNYSVPTTDPFLLSALGNSRAASLSDMRGNPESLKASFYSNMLQPVDPSARSLSYLALPQSPGLGYENSMCENEMALSLQALGTGIN